MNKEFGKVISENRPQFFTDLSAASLLGRLKPFNDEQAEEMAAKRAAHLEAAREQLNALEQAYHDDIRRMQEMFNRVLAGKSMDGDTD
jgi:hypothetical protein